MEGGDTTVTAEENTKKCDEGVGAGGGSEVVTINLRFIDGSKFTIDVSLGSTMASFKSVLADKFEIPAQNQRLIHKGNILKNEDQTLQSFGLEAGHTVYLVRAVTPCSAASTTITGSNTDAVNTNSAVAGDSASTLGGTPGRFRLGASWFSGSGLNGLRSGNDLFGSNTHAVSTNSALAGDSASTLGRTPGGFRLGASLFSGLGLNGLRSGNDLFGSNTHAVSTNSAMAGDSAALGGTLGRSGLGSSLFPGLSSNGLRSGNGLFGAGSPELEQMQQQFSEFPDMFRHINTMNMALSLIQIIMNNLQVSQTLMMNSLQMREIMDRNPELAHVLNDHASIHQTMETARNPGIMREMMRNTDRAMSNIEASPEGFNQLRRMYEAVQEPLLDATTMSGDYSSGYPFDVLLDSQVGGTGGSVLNNQSNSTTQTTGTSHGPNTNPLPNPWALAGSGAGRMNSNTSMNQTMQYPSEMMQRLPSYPRDINQRSFLFPSAVQQTTQERGQITGGSASGILDNAGLGRLTNMFGALGIGGLGVPSRPNVPPEEQYANQLTQLQAMGFFDTLENLRVLTATNGNVYVAVERLLGNSGLQT